MLQAIPEEDSDLLCVRVHDASFLGEQISKMGRRILSLEESIPSGVCQVLFDEYFTVIWHNKTYLEILGYTEKQFSEELQSRASGYIVPEDREIITRKLNEAVSQGQRTVTMETRIFLRGGEMRYLLTSLSFTDESVNGIPVLYSVGIDITAQKRALQLEIDSEHLRIAMEQASSYVLEYDVVKRRLLASESLKNSFGIDDTIENMPESLIQSGAVAPESIESIRSLFRQIEKGEEHAQSVVGFCRQPGLNADIWLRIRMSSAFDDTGRPVKAILLVEDITEHYLVEMQYREEEKRRVAMTYDMDFSCQINLTTGKIISAHESKFPYFDFNQTNSCIELIEEKALHIVHPDDRADYLRNLSVENMLKQFERGVPEISFDFRAKDENGVYGWNSCVAHIILEPSHGDVCAYFYTKNIDEEKERELELRRHAEQDALTGLYNRYTVELYCDQILSSQAEDTLCVMYMLDLDNFKYLNDTYGHLRGDEMLKQAAQCLRNIFGNAALLGRLGGDELVVVQMKCESPQEAERMVERICDTLRGLEAGEGVVTVSAGLAYAPQDGCTFAELYHCSDDALYQAKRAGKNGWAVYSKPQKKSSREPDRLPVSREWLLEESSDIVYVSDFYNYDLLYMNLGAKKMFGIEGEEYIGRKCYEVLQQKEHPCEFCTNHLLCRERFHCWEFRNRTVGKSLLLRDRIVDWYGVPARIEFATDVSAMDKRNQALEEQIEIDHEIIACLRILNSSKSLDEATGPMLEQLAAFYGADRAFILDYDPQTDILRSHYEWKKEGIRTIRMLIGDDGIQPDDALQKSLLENTNYLFDRTEGIKPEALRYHQVLYDAGIVCQRGVPFYVGDRPAGMIGLDNPTAFRDEVTVLETLSYFVSEELSRSKLSEKLAYLGYHDSLTGLYNRNRYVEYIGEIKEREISSLGIAVADLNALKDINKLRGHMQGDLVVKRAADLLRDCFPTALIFRLSGDEFVIHSENQDRLAFLEQITQVREKVADLQAHGISIGYAWTDREIDCPKLTTQATDIMLMQKKKYYQHEKEEHVTGKHNHAPVQMLLHLLDAGNFKMFLQPKADCSGFRLNGAEALVRFESPESGLIAPGRFIPALEQEHLIQYVDLFIFEEVCKLLARWKKEGRKLLTISLNFSRQTALQPDLLKTLLAITDRYQIPKDRIEVEITESLGDYDSSTVAEIGDSIKAAGFRLALDDFGSHYTNMAMLSAVPADVLKLDRGLVQDVMSSRPNQLVLKSILALCKELGISSIAEGVETQEQLELLRSLNCDSIQGYLFGRPGTVADFEKQYLSKI